MHKLHILFLPSWYPTSHTPLLGTFFREQAMALHKAGMRVGVVYPDIRSMRQVNYQAVLENHCQTVVVQEDGIPVVRFCGWNLPKFRRGDLFYTRHALRLTSIFIEKFGKPDIVHAQAALWGGHAASKVLRRFGIPYVITEHSTRFACNMIEPWQVSYLRNMYDNASAVMTVSKALSHSIKNYMRKRDVRVVPNVVDTNFFVMPEYQRTYKPFRFLSVSFLMAKKGIPVLLRAFSKVFKGQKDIVLEIGGDGPQRSELGSIVMELGISHQVRFLGMLSREQVRAAMWRANTFVLASHVETFGVVLIEAMSTGLPVVATRCGGPEEFVIPAVGMLAEAGNVESLASALRKAYETAGMYDAVKLRKYAIDNFGERKLVERLSGIYQDVLNNANNGSSA